MEENSSKPLNIFAGLMIIMLIIGTVVFLVTGGVKMIKDAAGKIFNMGKSLDAALLAEFDNQEIEGSKLVAMLNTNSEADLGLIIFTKKGGYTNYLRPLGDALVESGDTVEQTQILAGMKNILDNTNTESYIPGVFAFEDKNVRYTDRKLIQKSGSKHQVQDGALYRCKLIKDEGNIVGAACIQKGTTVDPAKDDARVAKPPTT